MGSPLASRVAAVAVAMVFAAVLPASAFPDGLPPEAQPSPNPWAAFQNLSGCHMGEDRQGLAGLKDYLSHFGYLPAPSSSSPFTDAFDEDLEAAVATYQRNFGLNATGALDASTVAQMVSPRCGVADVINGTSTMARNSSAAAAHGRHLYAYFPGSPTWPPFRRDLKYVITATSATSIDRSTLSEVFARAFSKWSAATNLRFAETSSESDADITIGFYTGSHGDGEPFDGPLGTLAHAFSPTDGRFHLDASEAWVATGDVSSSSVDLESVAVHEIGHLLGLGHSSVPEAIMYPTIRTGTRKVELESDDVQGIQSLYGSNPNYTATPSPATSSREMDSGAGAGIRPDAVFVGVVAAVGLLLAP
jgi:peptidoglycan hydrolase-like protein with peptidoglycan-binding domain